nr:endonuclease domain-containing protein [Chelativorans xinjiangense]
MTDAERRLWWHMREKLPLEGTHFRRQVPIGTYVVDFCCLRHWLIIEVDGNQHGTDAAIAYDARRDAYLRRQGFRVLRFSNYEIMRELDPVLDTIHAALVAPTPTRPRRQAVRATLPQGGGESLDSRRPRP